MDWSRIAWWITDGHEVSLIVLVTIAAGAILSLWALLEALDDARIVGRHDGGARLIARTRIKAESFRLAIQVLLFVMEMITLGLPPVGYAMPWAVIAVLALRKVLRLTISLLVVAWLLSDRRDRQQLIAYLQRR